MHTNGASLRSSALHGLQHTATCFPFLDTLSPLSPTPYSFTPTHFTPRDKSCPYNSGTQNFGVSHTHSHIWRDLTVTVLTTEGMPRASTRKRANRATTTVPDFGDAEEPDCIPARFTPLISETKTVLRGKLEEIENTASLDTAAIDDTQDALHRYKTRFAMSITEDDLNVTIYRFLKAHKCAVPKTVDALIATAEFRHRQNIDRMAVFLSLIPIRGYDEQEVCRSLNLPIVGERATTSSVYNQTCGTTEADEMVLQSEMNAFYSAPYSHLFDSEPPNLEREPSVPTGAPETAQRTTVSSAHNEPPPRGLLSRLVSRFNPFGKRDSVVSDESAQREAQANHRRERSYERGLFHRHRRAHETGPLSMSEEDESDSAESDVDESAQMESSGRAAADPEAALFMDTNSAAVFVSPAAGDESPYLNFHDLLTPIVRVLLQHAPLSFHYWDRDGRPVLYVNMAPLRSRLLMRQLNDLCPLSTEPKAVVMLYQAYVMEVLMQLIRFRDRKNVRDNEIRDALLRQSADTTATAQVLPKKGRVFNAVVIVDCKGVQVKHFLSRTLIQMAKPILTLVQRHYPETLHRLYVVNCQTSVSNIYTALRGVMTHETRQKIVFCDAENTPRTLKKVIDGDILPEQLGGRCHCFGACIPVPPRADASLSDTISMTSGISSQASLSASMSTQRGMRRLAVSPNSGAPTTLQFITKRLKLAARKHFKWSIPVTSSEEIVWEYREVHHEPITFAVAFVDVVMGEMYEVVARGRSTQGANHFIAPSDGVVLFEWSNRRSAVSSRTLRIKLYRDGETHGFNEEENWT